MNTTLHKVILKGPKLHEFLQRVMTQDIYQCTTPKRSAICNAYGKVIISFWVQVDQDATIWIDEPLVESFIKTIRYYDPFSSIEIAIDNSAVPGAELGYHSQDPWPLFLIKNNIVTLFPETQKRYTPHILCLEDAISLQKGCFIGHETIARTEFKGKVKRKLCYQTSTEKPNDYINLYFQDPEYHYLSIQIL